MSTCRLVCVNVYLQVSMCLCLPAGWYVLMSTCRLVCVNVYLQVGMCLCLPAGWYVLMSTCRLVCVYVYLQVGMCLCLPAGWYVLMSTCRLVCVNVYLQVTWRQIQLMEVGSRWRQVTVPPAWTDTAGSPHCPSWNTHRLAVWSFAH